MHLHHLKLTLLTMKGNNIIQESFKINLIVMKILRLYPPEQASYMHTVQVCVLYSLCIILASFLALIYLVCEEEFNFPKLSVNAIFASQVLCFIPKLLPFIKNSEQIKICINYFEDPYFTIRSENQKTIIGECIRICKRNTMVFFVGVTISVTGCLTRPVFMDGYVLPVDIWLPFSTKTDSKIYCFTYLYVTIAILYAGFAGSIIDPLIAGLACHAAGQLQILKDNLEHLTQYTQEEISENYDAEIFHQHMYGKIKECIKHHNVILEFTDLYEDCFSSVVFSQFTACVITIGFACLQLSMNSLLSLDSLLSAFYLSNLLIQIFFYCYYGTVLYEEADTLTDAIYMSNWYDYNKKSKKALIFLMENTKKPIIITAGKILEMSLETFTGVLKKSYSLLAVLKNFQ